MMQALITARRVGMKVVLASTIALAVIPPLVALLRGGSVAGFGASAGGLALLACLIAREGGALARLSASAALLGEVMLITASLAGHAWQLDSHMIYFAAMAVLVTLVDPVALVLAAGLVAIQHVGLSVVLPGLLYPAADLLTNM